MPFRGARVRFAPSPYGSRVAVPSTMRTMPFTLLRSHAWPARDLADFDAVVSNMAAHSISRSTFFLPGAGWRHPTQGMIGAVNAVTQSERRLASLQQLAVDKHVAGLPLTREEAREVMTLRAMPQTVDWQANNRRAARAACAPALSARQLPVYVVNTQTPALIKARAALQQPFGRLIDERSIISRQRVLAELLGSRVRGTVREVK